MVSHDSDKTTVKPHWTNNSNVFSLLLVAMELNKQCFRSFNSYGNLLGAPFQYNFLGAARVMVVVAWDVGGGRRTRLQVELGRGYRTKHAGGTPCWSYLKQLVLPLLFDSIVFIDI